MKRCIEVTNQITESLYEMFGHGNCTMQNLLASLASQLADLAGKDVERSPTNFRSNQEVIHSCNRVQRELDAIRIYVEGLKDECILSMIAENQYA